MRITQEILAQAVSDRGGFNWWQVEALGLTRPLKNGWKTRLFGAEYPDEQVAEFICLSSRQQTAESYHRSGEVPGRAVLKVAGNWAGLSSPVDIHLSVIALEGGRFYVGLMADVEQRRRQHSEGVGAEVRSRIGLSALCGAPPRPPTDIPATPLEQKVGVAAALHRDRCVRRTGNQTLRNHVGLERPSRSRRVRANSLD